jgi:type IV pilus assembly protein PilE
VASKGNREMTPPKIAPPRTAGFTLIEAMITVAIVAIIAAVALPNYIDYLTRSRLVEAKTNLADMRTRLEQYFLDNRTYVGFPCTPAESKFYNYGCVVDATTYIVTATGRDSMSGFAFTIDQANTRSTPNVQTSHGWHTPDPNTCWVSRKNGDC